MIEPVHPSNLVLVFFTLLLLVTGCGSPDQQNSSRYGHSMEITESPVEISWELLSNFVEDNKLRASLTLQNTGTEPIPAEGWTLYLNSIRALDAESFLPELKATHISGDFFSLEPTESFEAIPAGESFTIEYLAAFHAIKKTDAPQGFYFVYDDHIETVEKIAVKPFVTEEQVNRTPDDKLDVPTAESRFRENESLEILSRDQVGKITPSPVSVQYGNEVFALEDGIEIFYTGGFEAEADYLGEMLREQFDTDNSTQPLDDDGEIAGILLNHDPGYNGGDEAYSLQITGEKIEITASGRAGAFYAIQSLHALSSNRDSDDLLLRTVQIEDYSQFAYRGMHLDIARNFQPKESVLRLLNVMSLYKLNKFHFHLTDDEGWRLAIDELPELVEVGGRRGHTQNEEEFLYPSYGSGPDPTPGNSFGSGWLSRDDYVEILEYAGERHIEVIPEIDVPGHARAAIKAMEARYNRLSEAGQHEEADMYRLTDPSDESEYMSVQNFDDNVMNVCRESTYRFMEVVFDEIIEMHNEAGVPLNMIHVGGDEVPHGVWEKSPACSQYMEENSIERVDDLFHHFFERLASILENKGLKMAGWEEIALAEDGDDITANPGLKERAVPYLWSSIWGSGREEYAYMLANAGYNVVMSTASNLYLDMAYNKSWEESGFYWAAMFTTKDTYSFIPLDLYKNAERDNFGNPVDRDEYDDAVRLTDTGRENILGLQGQLWSETVNEPGRWEYMVLPRLLGLAERAWSGNPSWGGIEDVEQMHAERDTAWNEFANRLGQFEFDRLDRIYGDLNYRLPVPGAVIEDGFLKINSAFPGLEIRYELSGGEPGENSPIYEGPVEISGTDSVSISVFNSQGRSGGIAIVPSTDSD